MYSKKIFFVIVIFVLTNIFSEAKMQWYKGQLHCHSTNSDGLIPPEDVAAHYKKDGYSFIAITDHNKITNITYINTEDFITIPSVEITAGGPHVNSINMEQMPQQYWGLQICIDNCFKQGADLVQINHPMWSNLSPQKVASAENFNLLEVCNADDETHDYDIAVWDTLLTRGRRIFGTGTDDAHNYSSSSKHYNECWVVVFAEKLETNEIMSAIKSGDFYFCDRGGKITRIDMYERKLFVYSEDGVKIKFIGSGGKLLATVNDNKGEYILPNDELYVRAEVYNAKDEIAYTQAYFPDIYQEFNGKITGPEGEEVIEGSDVEFDINLFCDESDISEIKLYANDSLIGTVPSYENKITWSNVKKGDYFIKAKFITKDTLYYWSNPVEFKVVEGSKNKNDKLYFSGNNIKPVYNSNNLHINLNLQSDNYVLIELFSVNGKKIKTLNCGLLRKGKHKIELQNNAGTFVYFCKIKIGTKEKLIKINYRGI